MPLGSSGNGTWETTGRTGRLTVDSRNPCLSAGRCRRDPGLLGPRLLQRVYERNGKPKRFEDHCCTDVWFDEATEFIDENVGKIRRKLDEVGIADNTIIIFMGDNGTARGAT